MSEESSGGCVHRSFRKMGASEEIISAIPDRPRVADIERAAESAGFTSLIGGTYYISGPAPGILIYIPEPVRVDENGEAIGHAEFYYDAVAAAVRVKSWGLDIVGIVLFPSAKWGTEPLLSVPEVQ